MESTSFFAPPLSITTQLSTFIRLTGMRWYQRVV